MITLIAIIVGIIFWRTYRRDKQYLDSLDARKSSTKERIDLTDDDTSDWVTDHDNTASDWITDPTQSYLVGNIYHGTSMDPTTDLLY